MDVCVIYPIRISSIDGKIAKGEPFSPVCPLPFQQSSPKRPQLCPSRSSSWEDSSWLALGTLSPGLT